MNILLKISATMKKRQRDERMSYALLVQRKTEKLVT